MSTLVTCAWCRAEFPVELTACPRCGASADVRNVVDEGGWVEVPPMQDMAEIQFGRSRAQIEGVMVGVVDVDLAEGDSLFCTHDKLLWHDGTIKLSTRKGGILKSLMSGTPMTLLGVEGPGRIGFSDNLPGELIAMPLEPGAELISRQHHLLLATGNVEYEGFFLDRWYETEVESRDSEGKTEYEREMEHPLGSFEKFRAPADEPGLVILQGRGDVFMRTLSAGETIDVAPHSLLAWRGDATPGLMLERKSWSLGNNHYLSARIQGPVTLWIQSGTTGKTQEHKHIRRYGPDTTSRGF
jgi:uncharacterized protein (AIM24 family)